MMESLSRVARWRILLAGQILGTAGESKSARGVRGLQEARILLRVEMTALIGLLLKKGLVTQEELLRAVAEEADALDAVYAEQFPGFQITDDGLAVDLPEATRTMAAWGFPP